MSLTKLVAFADSIAPAQRRWTLRLCPLSSTSQRRTGLTRLNMISETSGWKKGSDAEVALQEGYRILAQVGCICKIIFFPANMQTHVAHVTETHDDVTAAKMRPLLFSGVPGRCHQICARGARFHPRYRHPARIYPSFNLTPPFSPDPSTWSVAVWCVCVYSADAQEWRAPSGNGAAGKHAAS
jgi:hypothetical protein